MLSVIVTCKSAVRGVRMSLFGDSNPQRCQYPPRFHRYYCWLRIRNLPLAWRTWYTQLALLYSHSNSRDGVIKATALAPRILKASWPCPWPWVPTKSFGLGLGLRSCPWLWPQVRNFLGYISAFLSWCCIRSLNCNKVGSWSLRIALKTKFRSLVVCWLFRPRSNFLL